jgi:diguanylate cyclase (GGDEF)-like protein
MSRPQDNSSRPAPRDTAAPAAAGDRLAAKQEALAAVVRTMSGRVQLDVLPVFEEVLARCCQALGASMACLHLLGEAEEGLTLVHERGLGGVWSRHWARLRPDGASPPALAFSRREGVELSGARAPAGLGAAAAAPITGAELSLGALTLLWTSPQGLAPDPHRLNFLATMGHLLGLAIEHAGLVAELVDRVGELGRLKEAEERRAAELDRLNRELTAANRRLEELSITDGLTGLFNRRHFLNRLQEEILRSRRQGHPLCLVMSDLDHFKRVNDTLGHQAGDEALKRFAAWLKTGVRRVDLVGRYGGEEFAVLLVDCGLNRGVKVADKLRRRVAERSAAPPFDALGGFTASMGVAQLDEQAGHRELIQAADQALYRAKAAGRNRVEPG